MVQAVAFMGCGWRFPFMFGVAKFIEDATQTDDWIFAGVSGGSGVAMSLCVRRVTEMYERGLAKRERCPVPPFGTCGLMSEVVREMGIDAADVDGRLVVGSSRLGKFELVPEFRSAWSATSGADLGDVIRGTCQIPFINGSIFHASANGSLYLDGEAAISIRTMREHLASIATDVIVVDFDDAADIRPSSLESDPPPMAPSRRFPRRWSFVYPDEATMRAMYTDGFLQATKFFAERGVKTTR
jgi:hypothetical protein